MNAKANQAVGQQPANSTPASGEKDWKDPKRYLWLLGLPCLVSAWPL